MYNKNIFYRSVQTSEGMLEQRLVFELDVSGSEAYKELQKAVETGRILAAEKPEEEQKKASTKIDANVVSANADADAKANEEKGEIDKQGKVDLRVALREVPKNRRLGAEPANKNSKDWKDWDAVKKANDENDAKKKAIEEKVKADIEAKKQAVDVELSALKRRFTTLANTSKRQLDAAVKGQADAKEKVKNKVDEALNAGLSGADIQTANDTSEFAAGLGDDDYLYKGDFDDELGEDIEDYLDSDFQGTSFDDEQIEAMTKGVLARLYDRSKPKNNQIGARGFLHKLATKGVDENHATISELKDRLIEEFNSNTPNESDQKKISGAADKLMNDIILCGDLNEEMRGMLLGELSKGGKGKVERINDMFALIKGSNKEWMSGGSEEEKLKKAFGAFLALEEGMKVGEFEKVVAQYKDLCAITGQASFPEVQKIIDECATPALMAEKKDALGKAIEAATNTYRTKEVEGLKNGPELKNFKKMMSFYELEGETSYDKEIDGFGRLSLNDFVVAKTGLADKITSSMTTNPQLVAAAAKLKDAANQRIKLIQEYKTKLEEAEKNDKTGGKKFRTLPEPAAIAALTTLITSDSPKQIMEMFEGDLADLETETASAQEGLQMLEDLNKKPQYQGGGGAYAGGWRESVSSVSATAAETAEEKAERQDKRPDNYENNPYEANKAPEWYRSWQQNKQKTDAPQAGFYVVTRKKGEQEESVLVEVKAENDKTEVAAYAPKATNTSVASNGGIEPSAPSDPTA